MNVLLIVTAILVGVLVVIYRAHLRHKQRMVTIQKHTTMDNLPLGAAHDSAAPYNEDEYEVTTVVQLIHTCNWGVPSVLSKDEVGREVLDHIIAELQRELSEDYVINEINIRKIQKL